MRAGTAAVRAGGALPLLRLAARRDRLLVTAWLVVLGGLPALTFAAYDSLYPSAAAREALSRTLGASSGLTALYGPVVDLHTAGGFTAWRMSAWAALLTALVAAVTTVRHSRREEEAGRTELVLAGAVHRLAPTVAAVLSGCAVGLLVGGFQTVFLLAVGAPPSGSVAFGLATAAAACACAAAAAVAAELFAAAHTVTAVAIAGLGLAFVARAVGDVSQDEPWLRWLSWASPLGWAVAVRPFVGDRWWVLVLPGALVVGATVAAIALRRRRDLGGAVVTEGSGPAVARPGLATAAALLWRLQRGSLAAWAVGAALVGAGLGSLVRPLVDVVRESDAVGAFTGFQGAPAQVLGAFTSALLVPFALLAAAAGSQAVLRAAREEEEGRLSLLLVCGVSRGRWWLAATLTGAATGTATLLSAAAGLAVTEHLTTDLAPPATDVALAALAQLPAVWVVIALAAALAAFSPRTAPVAWGIVAVAGLLALFGPAFGLDPRIVDASPFVHAPVLPSRTPSWTAVTVLVAVAAAALTGAWGVWRRRDVTS